MTQLKPGTKSNPKSEEKPTSTEVATRAPAAVAVLREEKEWAFQGDASDILIPRILLAQSTSKVVQDEKVAFGQLYRSTTLEALGGKDKPLALIPLYMTKTWVFSQKVGGKYEFRAIEPFTEENRNEPWQFTRPGNPVQEWKREQNLNFFCLLPTDIAKDQEARAQAAAGEIPDLDASLLPCVISFKSTSYKAGKTLVTHFAKAADFNMAPFVNFFEVKTTKTTNDQGTFYVLEVLKGGKTEKAHQELCKRWRNIVSNTAVKIDDSDVEERNEVETMTRAADGTPQEF